MKAGIIWKQNLTVNIMNNTLTAESAPPAETYWCCLTRSVLYNPVQRTNTTLGGRSSLLKVVLICVFCPSVNHVWITTQNHWWRLHQRKCYQDEWNPFSDSCTQSSLGWLVSPFHHQVLSGSLKHRYRWIIQW